VLRDAGPAALNHRSGNADAHKTKTENEFTVTEGNEGNGAVRRS
jgi:hypothetical protein